MRSWRPSAVRQPPSSRTDEPGDHGPAPVRLWRAVVQAGVRTRPPPHAVVRLVTALGTARTRWSRVVCRAGPPRSGSLATVVSGHTTQSTTTDPAGGRAGLAVVGPAVTAFLAYLATLTRPDLTGDERDLVASARRPFGTVARLFVDGDAATGGYEAFLHAWSRLVGEGSAFWLRLPSAAAITLAVGLTAGLACRWWGSSGAVTAGTFLALSPTAWRHALEVGSASLVVLLAVLSTWLLLSAADREQWTG